MLSLKSTSTIETSDMIPSFKVILVLPSSSLTGSRHISTKLMEMEVWKFIFIFSLSSYGRRGERERWVGWFPPCHLELLNNVQQCAQEAHRKINKSDSEWNGEAADGNEWLTHSRVEICKILQHKRALKYVYQTHSIESIDNIRFDYRFYAAIRVIVALLTTAMDYQARLFN